MGSEEKSNQINRDKFWIIKIAVDRLQSQNDLFLLFVVGEDDVPLTQHGRLFVYTEECFLASLKSIGFSFSSAMLNNEVDLTYDPQEIIDLVRRSSIDKRAVLINAINISLDIIEALNVALPLSYKKHLYAFADHLTFNRRYGSWFKLNKVTRQDLIDTFYWLHGALCSNLKFNSPFDQKTIEPFL